MPVRVARQQMLAGLGLLLALGVSVVLVPLLIGGSVSTPEESTASQTTAATTEGSETAKAESPKESPTGSIPSERSPTVTPSGYVIAPGCALWQVEYTFDLYYSPTRPTTICVQPPGSPDAGTPVDASQASLPPNCAVSPDGVVYCLAGGQLSTATLRGFYERGELQTPRI